MSDEFAILDLSLIVPSLTNPRKTFNALKLQELADSIRPSGVHQPVLVRPLPGSRMADTFDMHHAMFGGKGTPRPTHELVCGERRWRASKMAGKSTIPALIRDLTDHQVREIQIVENLQRDDLAELEEADGYQQLMECSNLTANQVAEKIGKSKGYVYARLKLLDLALESQQALREGKIDASRALLIARIPDSKLQIKALAYATKPDWSGDAPTVRSLQGWLKTNVMLRLEDAIFKTTDVRLVVDAGSCADCPKRTGANPDLFADVDSADICTDPSCYHGKEEAHRAALVKKAETKGMRIVQDKEALELMDGNHYRSKPAGYTDLSETRPDLSQEGERPLTLAQALGKDVPAPILFIHPRTHEVSELVLSAEAEAVLLAKGLIKAEARYAEKLHDFTRELNSLQEQAKRDTERAVQSAMEEAVASAIHQTTAAQAKTLLAGDVLRAFLLSELDDYDGEEVVARCARYEYAEGVDEMDAITAHLQRMGDSDLLRTTAHFLLNRAGLTSDEPDNPVATALAKLLGVDCKAVTKAAQASVKAKYADHIKGVQSKINAQKAPKPNAPAAQPEHAGGKSPKAEPKSRAPKPKLSEEDAKSGIAAAMQDAERASSAPEGAVASPAKLADVRQIRYRGPNGETWSGRGLKPRWLLVLMEAGRDKEDFAVPLQQQVKDVVGSGDNAGHDQAATDSADLAPGFPGDAFAIGDRIRITTDLDKLGSMVKRHAGKTGVIRQREPGGGYWHVSLRSGGLVLFAQDQLLAAESTVTA